MKFPDYVFVGIKGSVVALDRMTGTIIWEKELKGSDFVNMIHDDVFLYATTDGEAFCLDPTNGDIRWHNKLKGYGMDVASLLTAGATDQQGILLAEAERRQQQQRSAASSHTT